MKPLLGRDRAGIDPTMVISRVLPLADARNGYDLDVDAWNDCRQVVREA